jgi:mRNA-degrading endonuclease RelE of RelBE toxin-antitoxin system
MTLPFKLSDPLKKTLGKLAKKDNPLATALRKKIEQIVNCDISEIEHFKNLRGPKSHLKRVHIGSFVLTFRLEGKIVYFEDFDHHDNIYKR